MKSQDPVILALEPEQCKKLETVRALAAGWIASADTKSTTLLGLSGGLLTLFAVELAALQDHKALHGAVTFFALSYCIVAVLSMAAAGGALWPRVNRKAILSAKGMTPLERSATFFGDLGDLSAQNFVKTLQEADANQDALEQALIMTWIAREKMYYIGISLKLLVVSLIALGLCVITVALQS